MLNHFICLDLLPAISVLFVLLFCMALNCIEVNGCDSDPCLNGGVCYKGEGSTYVCVCPGTHTGTNCETELGRQLFYLFLA